MVFNGYGSNNTVGMDFLVEVSNPCLQIADNKPKITP